VQAKSRNEMSYYKEHKMNGIKERLVVAAFSVYLLERLVVAAFSVYLLEVYIFMYELL
jgi:hypothetical protein